MSDTVRTIIATPGLLLGIFGFIAIAMCYSDRSMAIGAVMVAAGTALVIAAAAV